MIYQQFDLVSGSGSLDNVLVGPTAATCRLARWAALGG